MLRTPHVASYVAETAPSVGKQRTTTQQITIRPPSSWLTRVHAASSTSLIYLPTRMRGFKHPPRPTTLRSPEERVKVSCIPEESIGRRYQQPRGSRPSIQRGHRRLLSQNGDLGWPSVPRRRRCSGGAPIDDDDASERDLEARRKISRRKRREATGRSSACATQVQQGGETWRHSTASAR